MQTSDTSGEDQCQEETPALSERRDRRRGMVMITIMIVSLVTMMIISVLINQFLTTEGRAVEQLLADSRFYWAMDGHATLVLSQAAARDDSAAGAVASLCGNGITCTNDADRLTEVKNLPDVQVTGAPPTTLRWDYDLAGAVTTKQFDTFIQDPGADINDTDTGTNDGRMFLTVSIPATNTTTGLPIGSFFWRDIFGVGAASDMRINQLRISFCTGAVGTSCSTTALLSGTPAPNEPADSGKNLITNVTRPR